jgi:hypothetical protein
MLENRFLDAQMGAHDLPPQYDDYPIHSNSGRRPATRAKNERFRIMSPGSEVR